MFQARLSSKFQLSIPKAMRHALDLKAGQEFTMLARGRIIELIPLNGQSKGMISDCECADSSKYWDRMQTSFIMPC